MAHPVDENGATPPGQILLVLLEVAGVDCVLLLFLADEHEGLSVVGHINSLLKTIELFQFFLIIALLDYFLRLGEIELGGGFIGCVLLLRDQRLLFHRFELQFLGTGEVVDLGDLGDLGYLDHLRGRLNCRHHLHHCLFLLLGNPLDQRFFTPLGERVNFFFVSRVSIFDDLQWSFDFGDVDEGGLLLVGGCLFEFVGGGLDVAEGEGLGGGLHEVGLGLLVGVSILRDEVAVIIGRVDEIVDKLAAFVLDGGGELVVGEGASFAVKVHIVFLVLFFPQIRHGFLILDERLVGLHPFSFVVEVHPQFVTLFVAHQA